MEFCQATLKIRFEKSIGGIVQKKSRSTFGETAFNYS
jgi:hypothetical protein